MAEIDSLEISIQSNIDKVNKNLDALIGKMGMVAKGISAIGSNKGLKEFAESTKNISESVTNMGAKVAQSMKPVQEQAKKISKTVEQVVSDVSKQYGNLGKGFKMEGSNEQIRKATSKIFNDLEKSKVDLQRISLGENVDYSKLEKAAIKVVELQNKYESLKNVLAESERYNNEFLQKNAEWSKQSAKNIGETAEEAKKLAELENIKVGEITGIKDATKAIKNYEHSLKNALTQKQNFETLGAVSGEPYLKSLEDIYLYENKIKELSKKFDIKIDLSSIDKAKDKIGELKEKFKDSGKTPYFIGNLEQLEKEIKKVESEFTTLQRRKGRMIELGKVNTAPFEALIRDIENVKNRLRGLRNETPKALNRTLEETAQKSQQLREQLTQLKIPTVNEENLAKLQNMLDKSKEKMISLKTELANKLTMGKITASVDDSGYVQLREQIALTGKTIDALQEKIKGASQQAKTSSAEMTAAFEESLKNLQVPPIQEDNLIKLQNTLKKTEADLEKLRIKLANGLTLGKITQDIDDSGYRNLREQIALTEKQADALREKIGNTSGFERFRQSMSGVSASSKAVGKAFTSLHNALKKLNSGINSVLSKIGKLVKSMFSLGNAAKESGKGFNLSLKTILKYGFGIRSIYALVNKLRNAVKEGMENLIQYSDRTNQSVSMLKSSLNQFKNASAAAFAPILNAIAPALNQLIQLFITATNAVNQFFAALTGQSSWIKAKYVYDDVAESIGGAAKAAKGALQPFDALNNLTTPSSGGGAGSTLAEDMFETLPIEDKFKDLSDKVKDIMSKLFDPLKSAWNSVGKKVMDAWKKALNNVWKMIKDIGRDFLKVWQEERTLKIFENILEIIKDIGLVISNLAENFRKAWNENDTGLKILQNIRNIIDVIIANIKEAADATVKWAEDLDFTPLLEAFERFTASLEPVMDTLSGILTDFYTQVLLPLGKWVLEEGLKELLDVFTAFNEKVDWVALRENLSEFWEHLEPFAETVGEGLIIFIQRVSDLVANFLNSETFVNFLKKLEEWMDNVTPEDVADGIEKLAKALVGLKIAIIGLTALKGLAEFTILMTNFGKAIGTIGKGTGTIGKAFSGSMLGATWDSLGGLKGILTTDLSTIGAATGSKIGLTIGTGIVAAIAGALAGGLEADFLDKYVIAPLLKPFNEELASYYENFKWFGEGGFFETITSDWKTSIIGFQNMIDDFESDPIFHELSKTLIGPWATAALAIPSHIKEIVNGFNNFKSIFTDGTWKDALSLWGDDIYNAFVTLGERQSETFENIKESIFKTWEDVKTKTFETWENAKTNLLDTWETLKSDASTKFESIKTSVSDIWSELKENTTNTWNAIKTAIKLPINAIIGFINKMISGVISGINSMTSALSKINFKVPDGFPMIGGKEFKISIPKVNAPQIPYLANGAVFNGGNPYLAVVNDQPRGQTNIEAPLKTIQEALQIELQNFNNSSGFNNGIDYGNGNSEALLNETRMQNQLLQQQNELLRAILAKPNISNGEIFNAVQSEAGDYKRRNGGKLAFT